MNKKDLLDKQLELYRKVHAKKVELENAGASLEEIREAVRKVFEDEQNNNPEIVNPNFADRSNLSSPK